MDQRANNIILKRGTNYVCHVTGQSFSNKQDAENHAEHLIASLDYQAGRPVTDRELRIGFQPVEDQDLRGQIARDAKSIRPAEPVAENPYRRMQAMQADGSYVRPGHQHTETEAERLERQANEWDKQQQAKQAEAERLSDPKRQAAIQHAKAERQKLQYTFGHTKTQLAEAERRIELATNGDLNEYAEADKLWRRQQREQLEQRQSLFDQQIAELEKRRNALNAASFEPQTDPREPHFAPDGRQLKFLPDGRGYYDLPPLEGK